MDYFVNFVFENDFGSFPASCPVFNVDVDGSAELVSGDRASFWTSQPSDAEPLPPKTPVSAALCVLQYC